tara:strand:- start:314 stop:736 length:423 start_codon:yes stop_codon:yes gene_type:complete
MRKLRWHGLDVAASYFSTGPLSMFNDMHGPPPYSNTFRSKVRSAQFFHERCFSRVVWTYQAKEQLDNVRNIDAIVCVPVYRLRIAFDHFNSSYSALEEKIRLLHLSPKKAFRRVVKDAFDKPSKARKRVLMYKQVTGERL